MKIKTLGGVAVAGAAIYALITYGIPAYQQSGGNDKDPNHVILNVNWSTSGGVENATVDWKVIGSDQGGPLTVAGGHWRHDVRLPGKGPHVVSLYATPVPIKVNDGKGGTFMKSAASSCAVIQLGNTHRASAVAEVGKGCSIIVTLVVK
jgi:hypothetical protein